MISKVNSAAACKRYAAALNDSLCPVGCLLASRLAAFYRVEQSPWHFFTSAGGQKPLALAVRGSAAWIRGNASQEELTLLLKVMGVNRLTAGESTLLPPGWQLGEQLQQFGLKTAMTGGPAPAGDFHMEKEPSLWQVAQLMAQQGFDEQARDNFYTDACLLKNRGMAKVYAVSCQNSLVAVAGAYCIHEKAAVLSGIYTRPEKRHKGLGRAVTQALSRDLLAEGRTVLLESAPGREGFYQAMGFEKTGTTRVFCPAKEQ